MITPTIRMHFARHTHFNTTGAGFSTAADNQLREYARLNDHKNIIGLLFDEMHIKEGLIFNKQKMLAI